MKRLHIGALTAVALVFGLSSQANAQAFRGFRVEGQVGLSQFNAVGGHKSKIGFGAAAGADFDLGGGFVLGAEGTFWTTRADVNKVDGAGVADVKTFEEWGIAARAGFLVTPSTLVYGKLGWVTDEQRKRFTPFVGTCGGNACQFPGFDTGARQAHGYVWGAGLNQYFGNNLYVSAEGRYSRYNNHTHMVTGLIGVGFAFGAATAAPPPPPATQTCPDGSVIAVTSTCPAPPPPPPPPPPPAERGERGQ
jgi:outer membrane immunogenic protein